MKSSEEGAGLANLPYSVTKKERYGRFEIEWLINFNHEGGNSHEYWCWITRDKRVVFGRTVWFDDMELLYKNIEYELKVPIKFLEEKKIEGNMENLFFKYGFRVIEEGTWV